MYEEYPLQIWLRFQLTTMHLAGICYTTELPCPYWTSGLILRMVELENFLEFIIKEKVNCKLKRWSHTLLVDLFEN